MNGDPYKELHLLVTTTTATTTTTTTLQTTSTNISSNMTSNSNITQTTDSLCILEFKTYLLLVGYAVVFVVGLIGNGFVLYTFRHYWRRGPIIELLILYLASFNFISSFLDPMTFGYWLVTCYKSWHFGWFACKIVPSLCRVSTNVSIGLILIMAIDRCRAIVFPFRRRLNRCTIHALVFIAIVIGFLSEVHHMVGSFINEKGLCDVVDVMGPGYLYPLIISISGRILTITFVLTFTTLTAYFKLKQSFDQKLLCASGNNTNRSLSERCRKVTIMLVVMATVFSVTILPRDFFHIIYAISWTTGTGIKLT